MSLKRDKVTQWTKNNGAAIEAHRNQPLPKTAGGIFGRSVFGLTSQVLGISTPFGLSPTGLFDKDSLIKAGKTWAFSKLGSAISSLTSQTNREFLESMNHSSLISGRGEGYRFNHEIENRGYLSFVYPDEAYNSILTPVDTLYAEGQELDVFTLPFFENPKISESRSPEYATHKIVNRNEPYRIWTGAKPSKVSLSFNITLPHLVMFATSHMTQYVKGELLTTEFKNYMLDFIKSQLNSTDTTTSDAQGFIDEIGGFAAALPTSFLSSSFSEDIYKTSNEILTDADNHLALGDSNSTRSQIILYVTYLLNIIRSSVIGSSNAADRGQGSSKTYLPAPVIFLTYGSMYSNSPFIATNYSITFDGNNGYEELSMLPRVIQIKLTLESFNQFEDSQKIYGVPKLFGVPAAKYEDAGSLPASTSDLGEEF